MPTSAGSLPDVCSFFFSSRRRHTSSTRDWSSDVCSSDLFGGHEALTLTAAGAFKTRELQYYATNYRQVLTAEGNSPINAGCKPKSSRPNQLSVSLSRINRDAIVPLASRIAGSSFVVIKNFS